MFKICCTYESHISSQDAAEPFLLYLKTGTLKQEIAS